MKTLVHLLRVAVRQVMRHRIRSLLTIAGVAAGMFLYTAVQTMQHSLAISTRASADDTTLVVYRENRFCPATSRLPEYYQADIKQIEGVAEVIPVQIVVNNCGASLDVISFRGVPPERLARYHPDLEVIAGSIEAWTAKSDGALIGEHFAAARGLRVGDQFEAVGVRVHVNGIIRSNSPQDNSVAYVHLPFLQQASRAGLGVVTQFNVRVTEPGQLDAVAGRIDELFRSGEAPTLTRPEKAFFAQTAKDMIELIGFTRWLGIGAVIAVMTLVANALILVVRSRTKENAILQTIGYSRLAVAWLMVCEGMILGFAGGLAGSGAASLFFHFKRLTIGNEGLTMALSPSLEVTLTGLSIALLLGLLASLWPAFLAARNPIIHSLRNA